MFVKNTSPSKAHFDFTVKAVNVSSGLSGHQEEKVVIAKGVAEVLTAGGVQQKLSKYHGEIVRSADGRVDLAAEIKKHPDALWIRVKAIEANRENDNGDYFSEEECVKSHKTFEGVPVFTNHENNKVENAKGKVVLAEWDPAEKAVYCTMFIDRAAHPGLCRAIEEGYVTDVSMGTQVEYSTCSVCEKKAYTADDYCEHVRTMKGRSVNGKKVFEKNFGLKFIELSVVTDGACKDCTIREIIDPEEFLSNTAPQMMRAAADINDFVKTNAPEAELQACAEIRICASMQKAADIFQEVVKTALMTKDSGQAEIQKLNQAMDLLEDVSRTMLDQRQYIDLEFLSKLVDVFADLQKVNDELVDQGYASVGAPAVAQQQQQQAFPPMPQPGQPGKEQDMQGTNQMSTGTGVGKITEPTTAGAAADAKTIFSAKIEELHQTAKKIYEEAKTLSGGNEVSNKHQETIEKVAKIWNNPSVRKFQTEISEGEWRIVVGTEEIYGMLGTQKVATAKRAELEPDVRERLSSDPYGTAAIMLDALKTKFANVTKVAEAAPVDGKSQLTQTMEAQLRDQKPPLHPRENEVRDKTTEGQLGDKHHDYEFHKRQEDPRTATTEHQLHKEDHHGYEDNQKPQNEPRKETFDGQLRDQGIKGNTTPAEGGPFVAGVKDQLGQTHEGQLDDWKNAQKNKNVAPDGTTEKQLRDQGDPLGRRIASKEDAKVVLATAMKAFVRTAAATAATPEEMIVAVASMMSSPEGQIEAAKLADAFAKDKDARESFIQRASFHGAASLKVASKDDVKQFLLGSLSDLGLDSKAGVSALKVLASQKDASKKIADAITAGLEEQKKIEAPVSMEDMLKEALAETADESVKVVLASDDVKGEFKTEADFAKAAFEVATKVASDNGVKVTGTVHVAKKNDGIEVELRGVRSEQKEAAKTTEVEARKEARAKLVEAQMPPAPSAAPSPMDAGGPAAGGGTTMPAGGADPAAGTPPVSALGEAGPDAPGDDAGGSGGEAVPPGTTCYVCGSDDVDFRGGDWDCNSCGATGHAKILIEVENWPGTLEEKTPTGGGDDMGMEGGLPEGGEDAAMGGMGGDMGAGGMPPVGIQASFRVTPEMVKKAGNKPIGSYCPHCASGNVKLASKSGSALGNCNNCGNTYQVEIEVDAANLGELKATVQWEDQNLKKLASKMAKPMSKQAKLASALKTRGLEAKFAKASWEEKANIVALLHNEGLID